MAGLLDILAQILPVGLSAGNAFAQNQAIQQAGQQTKGNVARANLQNAFGGNAIAQTVAPELGVLGQFGQAAQAGLGAFQQGQALKEQSDLRGLQSTQAQQGIDLNEIRLADDFARQEAVTGRQKDSEVSRFRLAEDEFKQMNLIRKRVTEDRERDLAEELRQKNRQELQDQQKLGDIRRTEARDKRAIFEDTRDAALAQEKDERAQRAADFEQLQDARATALALTTSERGAGSQLYRVMPSLRRVSDVKIAHGKVKALVADLIVVDENGVATLNPASTTKGAGQFTALNVFSKNFVDEAAAVRNEDIEAYKSAQDIYSRGALVIENLEEGSILTPGLIQEMGAAADIMLDLYTKGMIEAVQGRIPNLAGMQNNPEGQERLFQLAVGDILPQSRGGSLSEALEERKFRGGGSKGFAPPQTKGLLDKIGQLPQFPSMDPRRGGF